MTPDMTPCGPQLLAAAAAAGSPVPATVFAAFEHTARTHPQHPFLHIPASAAAAWNDGRPYDLRYGQALHQVQRLAERYRAKGYRGGCRVALLLENRPAFLLHYLALNAAGASAVPLNPDYRAAELEYVTRHSEAVLAVTWPQHVDRLRAAAPCPVVAAGDFAEDRDPLPDAGPGPAVTASDFTGEGGPLPDAAPRSPAADARGAECAVLYTSGTTGTPKGCLLSNAYCIAMGTHYVTEGGRCEVRAGAERLITPLPLFHMNALVASTMAMVLTGGSIIQLDRFHPASWWRDVFESGATILHYLGIMPAILLGQPPGEWDRRHAVRFGFGANANPRDHQAFEERFGVPLIEAWAMTETGAGGAITASREPRHPGTRCLGWPRPGLEIRLVDDEGSEVPGGAPGEALVRQSGAEARAGFFSGYLKDPDATAQVWRGEWFHTGDVMRRGPDGQYHFVDRRKNIVRRSGENIAALE